MELKTKTCSVTLFLADLWGNEKDGFDNNGDISAHSFLLEYKTGEELEKSLLEYAKGFCDHRSFPLSENRMMTMKDKKFWSKEWRSETELEIFFRGQYIGCFQLDED